MELTRSEMEIMDVFWEAQGPLSRSDLLVCSQDKSWKDSSVHILLNGMLQKGVISEAGLVKRSKTYSRTFLPTLSREQYFARTVFSRKIKPDVVGLIEQILISEDVTPDQMRQIKELVSGK